MSDRRLFITNLNVIETINDYTADGEYIEAAKLDPTLEVSAVRTVGANYAMSISDRAIFADATSGAIAITVPSPTAGLKVFIQKVDSSSNIVSVNPYSTETFDALSVLTLISQYSNVFMIADGANWHIIGAYTEGIETGRTIVSGSYVLSYDNTPEQIISISTKCLKVVFTALDSNENIIAIGGNTVSVNPPKGALLQPGGSVEFEIDDLCKIWVAGAINEGITFTYVA